MSHYNDFKTQINDPECLAAALCKEKIKGYVITRDMIEIHDKAKRLNGYYGNDVRNAHVILRKEKFGGYGDMGFVRNPDGTYTAIMDDSDCNGQYRGRLLMHYNIEKAKKEFAVKGIPVVETKDAKGRIQLRAKFTVEATSRIKVGR